MPIELTAATLDTRTIDPRSPSGPSGWTLARYLDAWRTRLNEPVKLTAITRFQTSRGLGFPWSSSTREGVEMPAAATTPPSGAPVDSVQAAVPFTTLSTSESLVISVLKNLTRSPLARRSALSLMSRTETKAPASRSACTVARPRPDALQDDESKVRPI